MSNFNYEFEPGDRVGEDLRNYELVQKERERCARIAREYDLDSSCDCLKGDVIAEKIEAGE